MLLSIALLVPLAAAPQWETAVGGNSARDGFVQVSGPQWVEEGWSVPVRTEVALQPVVGNDIVVYSRVPDWTQSTGSKVEARDLTTGALLWSTSLPTVGGGRWDAPVAIRNGIVYATRLYNGLADEPIHALDAKTGAYLWRSQALVNMDFLASPALLEHGDLLCSGKYVSGFGYRFVRIDGQDGTSVWNLRAPNGTTPRLSSLAVRDDAVYMVRDLSTGELLVRIDPDTGKELYAGPSLGSDLTESQNTLAVAPDGTVLWLYGSKDTSGEKPELIAWDDTGTSLVERWRFPTTSMLGSTLGVRDDGAVLTIGEEQELVLLDLSTGAVLRRSWPLILPGYHAEVRITVDREERAYVAITGGGGPAAPLPGSLLAFDRNLELLWARDLGLSPTTGATLAADGRLLVSTVKAVLRTFQAGGKPGVPARVAPHDGTRANPFCLQTSTAPLLGSTWRLLIDPARVPGTAFVGVLFCEDPLSLPTRHGELLVDPASHVLLHWRKPTNGSRDEFLLPVPADPALAGVVGFGQGVVFGPSGARLCNGLEAVIGD